MNESLKRQFEQATEADETVAKQRRTSREMGTVRMYDKSKGFGFINDVDDEKMFVHQSQIVATGFRRLVEGQKVSFVRGENDDRPWAEDVRNPDGSPIMHKEDLEESSTAAKKRRQQLKEQWRNFFDIPQYALKCYAESLPPTVANQDAFGLGEAVPQLGKIFVVAHGCASTTHRGNECVSFVKDRIPKLVAKVYEETSDVATSLTTAFQLIESEWMERAKMKSLTDGAEVMVGLFVHALNSSGQPCVQLWCANAGTCVPLLCDANGIASRLLDPHSTKKAREKLEEVGFEVSDNGTAKVSFAEDAVNKPSTIYRLPAARLIGGRPFKTTKAREKQAVHAVPDVKKVREWRCVAGEDLFLLICSAEVLSVLSDQDVINAAMDAWSGASSVDSWEAAAKAVVRTAQGQGPEFDTLACMAIQFWWQEKPLQRVLARRADKKRSGVVDTKKPADDGMDMFG